MSLSQLRPVRAFAVALALVASAFLGGCFDLEAEFRFNPDATGDTVVRMGFDKEMEDVFALVRTVAKYSTSPAVAALSSGVCSPAALAKAPAEIKQRVHLRKYMDGKRLVCESAVHVPVIDPSGPKPDSLGIFSMVQTAPRRWHLALDFDRVPDLTPFMMMALMQKLQDNPAYNGQIRGDEMMEIVAAAKKADIAFMTMAMRGRQVQLTVKAPRIVSSVGATSADATSVVFRMGYDELTRLLLDKDARHGKRYEVEVEY